MQAFYYSSMDQYPDTSRSFEAANLILISNALSPSESPQVQECDPSLGERPCLDEGCFLQSQLCDGVKNCLDGFDERGCSDPVVEMMEQINRYRLSR